MKILCNSTLRLWSFPKNPVAAKKSLMGAVERLNLSMLVVGIDHMTSDLNFHELSRITYKISQASDKVLWQLILKFPTFLQPSLVTRKVSGRGGLEHQN